ncbi:hypothetical protein N8772_03950 [Rickettsiales bacterium]|nr:hypothetical protein [Rickettsiales bacterium]
MINNTWYINHLKQIKEKSGPRYTPHLNIELPISEIFEGISKNKKFYTEIRKEYGELINEFNVASQYEDSALQTLYNELKQDIDNLLKIIDSIKNYNAEQIPWDNIYKQAQKLTENLWVFSDNLRKEKDRVKHIKAPINKNGGHQQSPSEKIDSYIYHIRKTIEVIRCFEEISSSTKAKLSNNPFLLITGKAGRGKTHLLCDVAENRINNNYPLPTFMVFGEYFYNEEDFWTQALKQLQINNTITKGDFLSELDRLGKEAECRSLFIIDALNENIPQAPNFWKNNLSGIIDDIKHSIQI